jgi:hypothetical protein
MMRLRFRLHTLMMGVAVAALATWGCLLLQRRSAELEAKATRHWNNMIYVDDEISRIGGTWNIFLKPRTADEEAKRARYLRRLDYEGHTFLKYSHAARLSWLAVGADPPPPAELVPLAPAWPNYRRMLRR